MQIEVLHTFVCERSHLRCMLFDLDMRVVEQLDDPVRIKGTPYDRYAFVGVPASYVDLIISRQLAGDWENPNHATCVVEISRKYGRFDGSPRDRLAIRRTSSRPAVPGHMRLTIRDDLFGVTIRPPGDRHAEPLWSGSWRRLRSEVDPSDLERIFLWHYSRYFRFLPWREDEINQAAAVWATEMAATDPLPGLAALNRAAERRLYREAVDAGYVKLTLGARLRAFGPEGKDMACWQRREAIDATYVSRGHASRLTDTVAEATRRAASGRGDFERSVAG